MSSNDKYSSGNFGDGPKLTNWILDLGAMGHMKQEVSDFIPGPLEDMDKHIEVADRHHVTSKQKVQVWINICDDQGYPLITMLHKVLLAQELCDRLFSIIRLMNLGHTCLFQKGFFTVYFGAKEKNVVTLPHSAQRKHAFWGKSRKCLRQRNFQQGRKLLYDYCIKE